MATGGNWSLGNGITTRVDALREELEFRSVKDPGSLSAEEEAVLAMTETERVERCVKLLNMTLESGNSLSLQTQHFSAALAKTEQDKRHGVGGVGELSRDNKVNPQPRGSRQERAAQVSRWWKATQLVKLRTIGRTCIRRGAALEAEAEAND